MTAHPKDTNGLILYCHVGNNGQQRAVSVSSDLRVLELMLRQTLRNGTEGLGIDSSELSSATGLYADALYKAIQHLREQLHDNIKPYRFIENSVKFGYRFIQPVTETDFESSAGAGSDGRQNFVREFEYPLEEDGSAEDGFLRLRNWDDGKWFARIIQESLMLQRKKNSTGPDVPREEIRILTTAFSRRVEDKSDYLHGLPSLLEAGVHVSVLFINPGNISLMKARHGLRTDFPEEVPSVLDWAVSHAGEQIRWLAGLISKHPKLLEARVTDSMPPAFVIRNSERALIGFFVAFGSFADVPLLEITPDSALWQGLEKDWDVRWAASENTPVKPSAH